MYNLFILEIQELEGGTYTIDNILHVINQLTIWAITIGLSLAGIAAVVNFIFLAVGDMEKKERAKKALVSLIFGVLGMFFSTSIINIIVRLFN